MRERAKMMGKNDANHIPNSKSEFRSTKQISNSRPKSCKPKSAPRF